MVFGGWKKSKLVAPKSNSSFAEFLNGVMAAVGKRATTEQDFYWFLIEVYDYLSELSNTSELLSGLRLHEIEYSGRKSEESYPQKRNEAARYFKEDVMGILRRSYSVSDANALLALTFVLIIEKNSEAMSMLRVKYAVHYHNNCLQSGNYGYADKWAEVIDDAENQNISVPSFKTFLPWET